MQTQSNYTRDQIEQCVKHVLQVLNRSITAQRNVEFTFTRIGKLQIKNGKAKMKFFKEFISEVDENAGKQIIDNMCNVRDFHRNKKYSLLFRDHKHPIQLCQNEKHLDHQLLLMLFSHGIFPTIYFSYLISFYRLNSRIGNPSMQAIQEENPNDEEQEEQTQQGKIRSLILIFVFLKKKDFSSFNTDKLDDLKLPSLNEPSEGRIFNFI